MNGLFLNALSLNALSLNAFPLLRKELRAATPYIALIFLFTCVAVADVLTSVRPDNVLLERSVSLLHNPIDMTIFNFLLAFSLAQGLITNEVDSGSLGWLDSLPTTRTRIFAAKLFVAWSVLMLMPAADALTGLVQHGVSRTSLETGWHAELVVTGVALHGLQIALFLALGVVLSFTHRLAWLILALLGFGLSALQDESSAFEIVDPVKLVAPVFEQGAWVVPWPAVAAQSALLALFILAGWALFQGSGVRVLQRIESARNTRGGRAAMVILGLLIVSAWFGLITWLAQKDSDDDDDKPTSQAPASNDRSREKFSGQADRIVVTKHFQMAFPAAHQQRALTLARDADDVHERVRSFLNAEPVGPISIDASRTLTDHGVAGLANWKAARISLPSISNQKRLLEVLAHETTHVYIASLTDRKFHKRNSATRLLNEGLSQYLGMRLYGDPDKLEAQRLYAAAMWSYARISLGELFNDDSLRRELDPDLVYAFGELFVHALVTVCGDDAPGRILVAYAKDDLDDRPGSELARVAFQRSDCDYDAVANAFVSELDARKEQRAAAGDPFEDLPGAQAEIVVEEHTFVARVRTKAEFARCRFRSGPGEGENRQLTRVAGEEGCRVPLSSFPRGTVDVQLGVTVPSLPGGTLWGRWERHPLRK